MEFNVSIFVGDQYLDEIHPSRPSQFGRVNSHPSRANVKANISPTSPSQLPKTHSHSPRAKAKR